MKKIFLVLTLLVTLMIFTSKVEALICNYKSNDGSSMKIDTDSHIDATVNYKGVIKDRIGPILNWSNDLDIGTYKLGYNGIEFIHIDPPTCPPIVLFGRMAPFETSVIINDLVTFILYFFPGIRIYTYYTYVTHKDFLYVAKNENDIATIKEALSTKIMTVGTIIENIKADVNEKDRIPIISSLIDAAITSAESRLDLEKVIWGWSKAENYPTTFYLQSYEENEEPEETFIPSSCLNFNDDFCESNQYFSCIWTDQGYCNTDELHYIKCGDLHDIPRQVPRIFSFAINFLKILAPIVLIIMGVISLVKTLFSAKEDEIKKAQSGLIRKLVAAVMLFLVVYIVQYIILTVAEDNEKDNISNCLSCLLNNECGNSTYYKTASGSDFYCTTLNDNKSYKCEDYYADQYTVVPIEKYMPSR